MPTKKATGKKDLQGGLFPAPVDTEVEAYDFIRQDLRDLKWVVRNPSLGTGGNVWTQNQCLQHPEIKVALGLMRPENIVKVSEKLVWIIEAKSTRKQLGKALDEAVNDYAKRINDASGTLRALLASGVAGNEAAGYLIKTQIRLDGRWHPVTINGQEATGLLSPESVKFLVENNTSDIHDYAPPQYLFLQAAERINSNLHIGGINKNDRAKTMAALLLSVLDEPPNLDTSLPVLIGEINARSKAKLIENGKADFFPFVKIIAPTSNKNHVKYKYALVLTIQELFKLNIRSAMNSRTDVLGQFYEVFLKYGNGAKEIGIVLTPRHITRFAVEAIGISYKDVVLDVACGTGGFLVAAFDHVRRTATAPQLEKFKEYSLFGIEQESAVAMLAIVNMIFRGDGKNNIVEGNSFTTHLTSHIAKGNHPSATFSDTPPESGHEAVTRVLMNPPFALRGSTDQEYLFVSAALSEMADGGLLFSLLPMDSMFGSREERVWRSGELLRKHTLLAVVSFPDELFYPAAQKQVVGIIVKKGFAHRRNQPVFWGRINRDGHLKIKSKRLAAADMVPVRQEHDDAVELLPLLRTFVSAPGASKINIPTLCKTAPIDFDDPLLELVPEAYLDSITPTEGQISAMLDLQIRQVISGVVTIDLRYENGVPTILEASRKAGPLPQKKSLNTPTAFKDFTLDTIFSLTAGDYHSLAAERSGPLPVASCADTDNGIIGSYSIPSSDVYENALTISYNGSPLTTKLHPYRFAAKDDVAVAIPLKDYPVEALIFIQAALNEERWRFSYYRKCFQAKLGRLLMKLPANDKGELDINWMASAVRAQPYWWFLAPRLADWRVVRRIPEKRSAQAKK